MGFLYKLRVAVWGVPPDTKAESRLLFKIDFFILTYVCLMYWVNYLVSQHLANEPYVKVVLNDRSGSSKSEQCLRVGCERGPELPGHSVESDQYDLCVTHFLIILRWLLATDFLQRSVYGGYLLGQIPNNLILQKVPPRIWLPTTCMSWGLLTLGTAFVDHPWQIMVIRFVSRSFLG